MDLHLVRLNVITYFFCIYMSKLRKNSPQITLAEHIAYSILLILLIILIYIRFASGKIGVYRDNFVMLGAFCICVPFYINLYRAIADKCIYDPFRYFFNSDLYYTWSENRFMFLLSVSFTIFILAIMTYILAMFGLSLLVSSA